LKEFLLTIFSRGILYENRRVLEIEGSNAPGDSRMGGIQFMQVIDPIMSHPLEQWRKPFHKFFESSRYERDFHMPAASRRFSSAASPSASRGRIN